MCGHLKTQVSKTMTSSFSKSCVQSVVQIDVTFLRGGGGGGGLNSCVFKMLPWEAKTKSNMTCTTTTTTTKQKGKKNKQIKTDTRGRAKRLKNDTCRRVNFWKRNFLMRFTCGQDFYKLTEGFNEFLCDWDRGKLPPPPPPPPHPSEGDVLVSDKLHWTWTTLFIKNFIVSPNLHFCD